MPDPAIGIKDLLVSAGVGAEAATTGWGVYVAQEPTEPDTVITVYNTPGENPNPKWLLDYPHVQVRIRGSRTNGYVAARSKAQAVKDALLGLPSQDLNGDRWVHINGLGDIFDLGFDDNNRPLFTTNFALIIEPAAGTNRIAL